MTTITTNTTKMPTKREMFEQIKAKYALTVEEIAFIDHEIELLAPKKTKKELAEAEANANLRERMAEFLNQHREQVFNRDELAAEFNITPGKVTAQMGVLVGENVAMKYKGKNAEGKVCTCYGVAKSE